MLCLKPACTSSEIFWKLYSQVLKESFKVYCAINEGIINLVEKVGPIFSFPLELLSPFLCSLISYCFIYAYIAVLWNAKTWGHQGPWNIQACGSAGNVVGLFSLLVPYRFHSTRVNLSMQAGNLSDFYEVCKGLELARNFQFPVLREVSDNNLLIKFKFVMAGTLLLWCNSMFVFWSLHNLFLQQWRNIWETHHKWSTSHLGHWYVYILIYGPTETMVFLL